MAWRGAAGRVRSDLEEIPGPRTKRVQALYDRPEEGLERLAKEVEGYWEAGMAPYWPRIRSLLEGEILHQHLTALRRAGLCTAHRTGRYVLYARTAAAEALLAPHAAKPG